MTIHWKIGGAFIAGAFFGGLGAGIFGPGSPPPAVDVQPVMLEDVRAVVAAMEPFENGSSWERASVCVRSHLKGSYGSVATVGVELHTSPDSKFISWADTLPDAVRGLTGQSDRIKTALSEFAYVKVKP